MQGALARVSRGEAALIITSKLSSAELLARFESIVARDRATTVQLLRCLGEIDRRRLWAAEG